MPAPVVLGCAYATWTASQPWIVGLLCVIFVGSNLALNTFIKLQSDPGTLLLRRCAVLRALVLIILLPLIVYFGGPGADWWVPLPPGLMALGLLLPGAQTLFAGGVVVAGSGLAQWLAGGSSHLLAGLLVGTMVLIFMIPVGHALRRRVERLTALTVELELEAHRAQEGSRAKSAFLAHMSHEIRTPLNGIIGSLELARSSTGADSREELLVAAADAASHLQGLLDNVLDVSKIEAGEMSTELVPTSIVDLQGQVLATFGALAQERDLDFKVQIDPSMRRWGLTDPTRIRQIVFNLLGNALKFTEAGSVRVRFSQPDAQLQIEVVDSGIGIPPDRQASIFDAFQQADDGTTRRHGGSGLGLALVREMTHLLGGSIQVQSTRGEGSTFVVRLPWAECEEPVPSREALPDFDLRVLIAEDNRVNQMVAQRYLERLGCEVVVVEDGVRALESLAESTFDLVLMDCHMPRLDGFAAARLARERGETLAIVALTASVLKSDLERCLASGMNDFLSKPIDKVALVRCLETIPKRS